MNVNPITSAESSAQPVASFEADRCEVGKSDQERRTTVRVPLAQEEIHVQKETVETGRVRVSKTVHERSEAVAMPLYAEEVEVERVRVDRVVDSAPTVRREGDTLVIPLVEEVLVKQLVVREEIRIRQIRRELPQPEPETLRYEQAHIERVSEDNPTGGASRVESQGQQEKET